MKKQLFFSMLFLIIVNMVQAQSYQWGKRFGGDSDDVVRNMVVDKQGNTYTTGYFAYTATFGSGQHAISITSNGLSDIFVIKANSEGEVVWAKNFGGVDNDYANGISLDSEGNLLLTGSFQETVDFSPELSGNILTSNGFQDLFVLKLDSAGNFIWVKGFGSSNYEECISVANDSAGNVYLTGYFFSSMDFDPSEQIFTMNPTSDSGNGFIMKMNASGDFQWAKQIGGSGATYSKFIKILDNGEIYVLGDFTGNCDFDPGSNSLIATSAGKDMYALHLDSSGNFINLHTSAVLDDSMSVESYRMDVDTFGNVYVIGNFSGSVNFNPSQPDQPEFNLVTDSFYYNGFILKMKKSGEAEWVRKIGGSNMILTYDIAVAKQNDLFITGFFSKNAKFGTINLSHQSTNLMDAFITKMNSNGEFKSANAFGGTGGGGHEIEIGEKRDIYLSSSFHNTVDLNPYDAQEFVTASGEDGYRDIYLIKLSTENLGVIQNSLDATTTIYPNPVQSSINIKSTTNFARKEFKIYDVTGKHVMRGIINNNKQIVVDNLIKGVYLLVIDSNVKIKFIKY